MWFDIYALVIGFVFGTAAGFMVFRIWLQLIRAPFSDPFVQSFYMFLAPLLRPFERFIPRYGNFNIAAAVVTYLICLLWSLLLLLGVSTVTPLFALSLLLDVVFYCIFIAAIANMVLSFMGPSNSLGAIVFRLFDPLVRPIRKRLPMFGPIDLSIAVLLLLVTIVYKICQHLLGILYS